MIKNIHWYDCYAIVEGNNRKDLFLTRTQFDILRLYSKGKNVQEIAEELLKGISIDEEKSDKIHENINKLINHYMELGLILGEDVIETGEYGKFYPKTLNIELTDRCNFFCSHCYKEASNNKRDSFDIEKLKGILEKFKGKIAVLNLTGGEPLLHPEVKEIIRSFGNYYFINITTNGSLIKNLSEGEIRLVNHFQISFYGSDEEQYKKVTNRKGMYRRVKEAIDLLTELDVPFSIAIMLNRDVCENISLYREMLEKTCVSYIIFSKVGRLGRATCCDEDFWNVTEEMEKSLEKYVKGSFGIETNLSVKNDIEYLKNHEGCTAGKLQFTISEKGKLLWCNILDHDFFSLGECDMLYSYVERGCDCNQMKLKMELYKNEHDCRGHICPLLGGGTDEKVFCE